MYKKAIEAATNYTNIILLSPQKIVEDGIRYQNQANIFKIHNMIKNFLDEHNVSYIEADYTVDKQELVRKILGLNTTEDLKKNT